MDKLKQDMEEYLRLAREDIQSLDERCQSLTELAEKLKTRYDKDRSKLEPVLTALKEKRLEATKTEDRLTTLKRELNNENRNSTTVSKKLEKLKPLVPELEDLVQTLMKLKLSSESLVLNFKAIKMDYNRIEQTGHDSAVAVAALPALFGGVLPPAISGKNARSTVHVTDLNPDRINEEKIFNLFSLYGNVITIRLMRSKRGEGLVQMSDGFEAELAIYFLKGAMLFGNPLGAHISKHLNVKTGEGAHDCSKLLQRFNGNAAKNYQNCCSPTKAIQISTLPQDVTEVQIVTHFEEHGQIKATKLFEVNTKKEAFVLFETEEQATEALMCKHGTSLGDSTIRISFSQLQNI